MAKSLTRADSMKAAWQDPESKARWYKAASRQTVERIGTSAIAIPIVVHGIEFGSKAAAMRHFEWSFHQLQSVLENGGTGYPEGKRGPKKKPYLINGVIYMGGAAARTILRENGLGCVRIIRALREARDAASRMISQPKFRSKASRK